MNILALAGDAGGARALLPVIRQLMAMPEVRVDCYAYAAATALWSSEGLRASPPERIRLDGVDCVMLGTTVGPEQWEVEIIRRARAARLKTVSFVDAWLHYHERFTARDGTEHWPDVIAVIDGDTKAEMRAEGFPLPRIVVTGHPSFDGLAAYGDAGRRAKARQALREWAGCQGGEPCVVYVSQPLSQLCPRDVLGFHESEALEGTVEALERLLARRRTKATLVIKSHPREAGASFELWGERRSLRVQRCLDSWDRLDLVVGADLIVGMNSMLLMEACVLGRPVVSYQPNLRTPDPLPTNRRGWSRAVYEPEQLEWALEEELFDAKAIAARGAILSRVRAAEGAVERMIDVVLGRERIAC